jgi:lipopolysaccharide export system permease protein
LGKEQPNLKAYSTIYLVKHPTPRNLSELEWRLGLPFSALILSLLAIPLSYVDNRSGRSLNLITAIVIYMFYNNMISVSNSWVAQRKIDAVTGFWGLHLLMLAVLALFFYHRSSVFSWRRWKR